MIMYIIRHGETDWNAKKLLQGRADIDLNEYGRKLALITAGALKEVPFDTAISSPLKRAVETAEIILGNRNVPILQDDRIQEISFGEYEGLCCGNEGYNIPDPDFQLFFTSPDQFCPPSGGESIGDVCKRTASFMEELVRSEAYENSTVLTATHGAAYRGLLSYIDKKPQADFWKEGIPKNCAVTVIEILHRKITILEKDKVYYP